MNKNLSAVMCHINKFVLFPLKIVLLQLIECLLQPSKLALADDDIEEAKSNLRMAWAHLMSDYIVLSGQWLALEQDYLFL